MTQARKIQQIPEGDCYIPDLRQGFAKTGFDSLYGLGMAKPVCKSPEQFGPSKQAY
jgi:hypothetical protein